jgi:hypothetical protein
MNSADNKNLTFRQYLKLNKSTTIQCLKVSSLVFGVIATIGTFAIGLKTGEKTDSWEILIACELFGYGFAVFILIVAIIEGYAKARVTINQYNKIDDHLKRQYSIELVKRPLNPKYWFMQFDIVRKDGDDYYPIDEELKQRPIK